MSAEMEVARVALPFRVGSRTLGQVRRRLLRLSVPLEQALAGELPALGGSLAGADGYYLRALPETLVSAVERDGMRSFLRQAYPRHYARLDQPFDTYVASLSGNARSALKRKRRKLEARSGGLLDVRLYRRPDEVEAFFDGARAVSALTYQEQRLDAGLPEDALAEMHRLAAADAMRGWLLFLDSRPVSYLYAPAQGETLVYAYLGYDPAAAELSPGTVLQLEAMRMLMEEGRFRWFDFTEGDGQHKRQLATGSIPSVDLLLLRPSLGNFAAARGLDAFDAAVAVGKRLAESLRMGGVVRALRR